MRPRVLFFTSLFPLDVEPTRGVFSRSTAEAIARAGCEVTVVVPVSLTPPAATGRSAEARRAWLGRVRGVRPQTSLPNVAIPWLPPPTPLVGFHASRAFGWERARAVRRLIDSVRPDTIVAKWLPDALAACAVGRRFGVPVIAGAIGGDVHSLPAVWRGWSWAREMLNTQAAAVTFVSHALRREGEARGLTAPAHVIPYGVDGSQFSSLPAGERRNRILAVGNLYPVKGQDVLIDAFASLVKTRSDLELRIIGAGTEYAALLERARSAGVAGQVTFVAPMSHALLAGEYRAARVLAMPSRNEGLPNVALEALASGTPVVATRVGGLPEIVRAESGLLVEPDDSPALAAALATALDREWDRGAVSASVTSRFPWESTGAAYRDLVLEVSR